MYIKTSEGRELIAYLLMGIVIVLAFSYFVFGITGARVMMGIGLITVPFYMILNNFSIDEGEKIVFSFLMGFTLFSSLAYLFGLVISFRLGILLAFIILAALAFLIRKFKS